MLNAEDETARTKIRAEEQSRKLRRESLEQEQLAKKLARELEEKDKEATSLKKRTKKEIDQLKSRLESSKLGFDIQITQVQKNCSDLLLDEFKKNASQENEDTLAAAIRKEAEERWQLVKAHGDQVRQLESDLFEAKCVADNIQANAVAMLDENRKEVTKQLQSKHNEEVDALTRAQQEKQKKFEELERSHEQLSKTLEDLVNDEINSAHECKFSSIAQACLLPEMFHRCSQRQRLDTLGARARSVADMSRKGRNNLARITLHTINKICTAAKAGTPDSEGVVRAMRTLPEFKLSPLSVLVEDTVEKDSATAGVLAHAYKSAVRSNDKVCSLNKMKVCFRYFHILSCYI